MRKAAEHKELRNILTLSSPCIPELRRQRIIRTGILIKLIKEQSGFYVAEVIIHPVVCVCTLYIYNCIYTHTHLKIGIYYLKQHYAMMISSIIMNNVGRKCTV